MQCKLNIDFSIVVCPSGPPAHLLRPCYICFMVFSVLTSSVIFVTSLTYLRQIVLFLIQFASEFLCLLRCLIFVVT